MMPDKHHECKPMNTEVYHLCILLKGNKAFLRAELFLSNVAVTIPILSCPWCGEVFDPSKEKEETVKIPRTIFEHIMDVLDEVSDECDRNSEENIINVLRELKKADTRKGGKNGSSSHS